MTKAFYSMLLGATIASGAASAQSYCTPSSSSSSCMYHMGYDTLKLTGASGVILDDSGCVSSGYALRTALSCTLNAGTTYTANFSFRAGYPKNFQMWVDFNNDGTFDTTEVVGGANFIGTTVSTAALAVAIPGSAASGTHRFRVLADYGSSVSYPHMNPCRTSSSAYGDARDYSIVIAGSGSCSGTPVGGTATVSETASCGMRYVVASVSAASSGAGYTYQWQYSTGGGSWTNIAGATSTSYSSGPVANGTIFRCLVTCTGSGMTAYSTVDTLIAGSVSGRIEFSGPAPDTTICNVWLIKLDTAMHTLTAVDSQITCNDSIYSYYAFNHLTAGTSYLVKAMSFDATSTVAGASGYVPTYGYSNAHWDTGTVITHTFGADDTLNIRMIYGTVPSGPGFIGGSILSGAGKGTSGDVGLAHALVLLEDAATHTLTHTYTDATGAYSFSGIAYGSYIIYPEYMGYVTTSSSVTLSSSAASRSGINFRQSTTYKTIKPVAASVAMVTNEAAFAIHPNPASNTINLSWTRSTGMATIVVTNVTGAVVAERAADLTAGATTIDAAAFSNGVYIVKVITASGTYTQKVTVAK